MQFQELDGYPETRVSSGAPLVRFDRTQGFGVDDRLNFEIIANWVIAEHKSQGVMQLRMNQFKTECYWSFDTNAPGHEDALKALFARLAPE